MYVKRQAVKLLYHGALYGNITALEFGEKFEEKSQEKLNFSAIVAEMPYDRTRVLLF
jgi:hypothetical protein